MKITRKTARAKANKRMSFLAGTALRLFSRSPKIDPKNQRNSDFKTSTQRMGLSYSEKIRNTFRGKWLRKR